MFMNVNRLQGKENKIRKVVTSLTVAGQEGRVQALVKYPRYVSSTASCGQSVADAVEQSGNQLQYTWCDHGIEDLPACMLHLSCHTIDREHDEDECQARQVHSGSK
jgi:hypothetical protein